MNDAITKLTIEGFKSIRELKDFKLRSLNVLIGANGAGKSNFIGFFRLLRELIEQRLQLALRTQEGGANACLYMGPKVTQRFAAKLYLGQYEYEFALMPEVGNRLVFAKESTQFVVHYAGLHDLGSGHSEAKLRDFIDRDREGAPRGVNHRVYQAISSSVVY